VKIATIGGGERGQSAVYLLSHHRGDALFDREEYRGGHANNLGAEGEYVAHPAASSKGTDDVQVR
jgi:predicted NAD/FAD-binding protein